MEGQSAARRGGRPRKPEGEGYSAHVTVKLTPQQRDAAMALAARRGHCALSVYLRQMILAQVETEAQRQSGGTP